MEQKRVLIVDDEQDLCEILQFNLIAAGYEADVAYSAEEALDRLSSIHPQASHPFDLLLLDVMMPRLSGFELAERLKADEQTAQLPIIFLTAKDTEEDTLAGFRLGADDYVTKPFSVREVVARVNAVLKRNQPPTTLLQYEGLVVDQNSKTVSIDNIAADLTRTEFELLALLLSHRGRVFSRQELIDCVWPDDVIVTERSVDVSITRLRKKLGCYAACILTRQGFGYGFK
jgi:DNA-binding response OmpR family regulator